MDKFQFHKTEKGAIISHGLHDHVGASCTVKSLIYLIQDLSENDLFNQDEGLREVGQKRIKEYCERLTDRITVMDKCMDYIYTNIKDLEEQSQK